MTIAGRMGRSRSEVKKIKRVGGNTTTEAETQKKVQKRRTRKQKTLREREKKGFWKISRPRSQPSHPPAQSRRQSHSLRPAAEIQSAPQIPEYLPVSADQMFAGASAKHPRIPPQISHKPRQTPRSGRRRPETSRRGVRFGLKTSMNLDPRHPTPSGTPA